MNLANVRISRVIAHEVVRASQLAERPPILSEALITLDARGMDLVGKRLVSTVASGSHCVDVTVDDATQGSPFDRASAMLDHPDTEYVDASKLLAHSLSTSQTAGPIKSGSAIFVQGTCAADGQDCRFLAVIKADSDQGFYKHVNGENITLTYVSDMLLGESQRLIKIAFFIEDAPLDAEAAGQGRQPEDFSIKVFDHMMQNSGDGNAAVYFYSTFLKCRLADNAPRRTKHFYDVAREFIDHMNVPQADIVELRGDLISYLRGNRATLEPRTFAQDVLPEDQQDSFLRKCREAGITQAITKDISLLKGKLRRQSLKFSSNVTLYAPSEVFREAVRITGTTEDGWTELRIRGLVETMP
jgi:hypothetical protein